MTSLRGRGRGGPGGGLATGGIGGGARGGANGINGDGPNVRRGSWRGGPPGAGGVWGTPRGGSPALGHSSSPAPRQSINDHMNVIGKVTDDKSKSAATRTFATDKDISGAASGGAQRELQPWSSDEPPVPATNGKANGATAGVRDLETFGSSGTTSNIPWDQFETNSRLFGATTDYQEEIYTTKLNKSTPDYKSREKEATRLANEIMGQTSNNAHVAEERNQAVADHSKDEEDKYSGVQRNPNAYVPPAARRAGNAGSQAAPSPRPSAALATEPKSNGAVPAAQPELLVAPAVTRSTSDDPAIKAEPLADVKKPQSPPAKSTSGLTAPPAPTPEKEGQQGQTVVDHFRQFVGSERERAEAKKQSLAKQDRERTLADFKKFGTSFNIPLPMPKDILPLLSKDEDKQKAIEAKAAVNLEKAKAAKTQSPAALKSPPAAPASATPTSKKIAMKIPEIPPFKPRQSLAAHPVPPPPVITVPEGAERDIPMPTSPTPSAGSHASANALAKLNPKASAFVFKPTAAAFKPGQASTVTSSPVAKPSTVSPAAGPSQPKNPFFGSQIPQSRGISPRDDFNPWKHDQVVPAASSILPQWPYTGRKHNAAFLGGPMHVMPMGGGFDEDPNNLHAGPPQLLPGMPPNFPPYPYRYQPGMPPQGMPGQMGSPMFSPGPNYQQLPGMQPPMHMGGPPQQNGMPLHYFQNGMPHNPQFMPPQHMQFNPNSPQRHGPGGPVPGGPGGPSGPGGPGPGHSPMFYQQHQMPTPQQTPQMHHNALQPPPQPQFQSSPLQPPPIPGGGFDGGGHQ